MSPRIPPTWEGESSAEIPLVLELLQLPELAPEVWVLQLDEEPSPCPTDDELLDLIARPAAVPAEKLAALGTHVAQCAECAELFALSLEGGAS